MNSVAQTTSQTTSQSATERRIAGLLLIITPIAFMTFFSILGAIFDYPAILRQPTELVLKRFQEGGAGLIATWYGMTMSAVIFIPLVLLVEKLFNATKAPLMRVATVIGVLAGAVQMLGFIRWPFLVPYLSQTFLDPASSPATREATAVVFQTFNQYAGVGIGENLGYLFTSVWTILFAISMFRSPRFPNWLGIAGILPALGIFIGMAEPAGLEIAAPINAVAYILWAIWLVVVGIVVLRGGNDAE